MLSGLSALLLWLPQAAPVASALQSGTLGMLGIAAEALPLAGFAVGVESLRERGRPFRVGVTLAGLFITCAVFGATITGGRTSEIGGWLGTKLAAILIQSLGRPLALALSVSSVLALGACGLGIPVWKPVAAGVGWAERVVRQRRRRRGSAHIPSDESGKLSSVTEPRSEPSSTRYPEKVYELATAVNSEDSECVVEPTKPKASPVNSTGSENRGNIRESNKFPDQLTLRLGDAKSSFPVTSYPLPPVSLLREGSGAAPHKSSLEEVGRVLIETLRQFDVEASLSGITPGPTVTRFEVELAAGVKVAKVKSLSDDIAYALAAESVRIQAPIPGKSAIGIEIPNRERRLVTVGDVLGSSAGKDASHPLDCALGKDISGKPVMINLGEMPHLLIAGTTGGGKSSTINALVTSLIMRNGPEQVRLLLVDPKRVELGVYDGIPHLLTRVVTNPKRASEALGWVVREMELRYEKLAELGARDISSYNASILSNGGKLKGETFEHNVMGYIVVVVDELNDLMMVAARDVEDSIMRLAQMARAVGIHLVIATQRPSTNVITGVIKANIPSRIAFKVGSQIDSRVILDTGGAEELLGMGDMLLLTASSGVPKRIQGCYVSEEEVRKIVAHWRRLVPKPEYLDDVVFTSRETPDNTCDDDELLEQAMDLVVQTQLGSTSMLQRKLRVGFARAGRLMDLLEKRGVVGPSEGSKARVVLVSPEEYEEFKRRRSVDDGIYPN
ncbi:MAG: cell division protein FtsK [Acidimicrobiia bacterium]